MWRTQRLMGAANTLRVMRFLVNVNDLPATKNYATP